MCIDVCVDVYVCVCGTHFAMILATRCLYYYYVLLFMNQLQLMSVCARNDFLVIHASQMWWATTNRQLDKQTDRQTYIGKGIRIEMKRNGDGEGKGKGERGSVSGLSCVHSFVIHFPFWLNIFSFFFSLFSHVIPRDVLLRFLFVMPWERIEVCGKEIKRILMRCAWMFLWSFCFCFYNFKTAPMQK